MQPLGKGGGGNIYMLSPGHMTKIAATLMNSKNLKKPFCPQSLGRLP